MNEKKVEIVSQRSREIGRKVLKIIEVDEGQWVASNKKLGVSIK
jgi:hypothetical protein